MDVVRKNGDKINTAELSRELGCEVIEISALKGTGVMEAAEAAIKAAEGTKTVPMHTFSGPVEHALAHIEEVAVHQMPEEQQLVRHQDLRARREGHGTAQALCRCAGAH